jgi:hypothetical protein
VLAKGIYVVMYATTHDRLTLLFLYELVLFNVKIKEAKTVSKLKTFRLQLFTSQKEMQWPESMIWGDVKFKNTQKLKMRHSNLFPFSQNSLTVVSYSHFILQRHKKINWSIATNNSTLPCLTLYGGGNVALMFARIFCHYSTIGFLLWWLYFENKRCKTYKQ